MAQPNPEPNPPLETKRDTQDVTSIIQSLFVVNPVAPALCLEKTITYIVLVIAASFVYIIYEILTSAVYCFDENSSNEPIRYDASISLDNSFYNLACGTQIKKEAQLYILWLFGDLLILISIFVFNKIFVSSLDRYYRILVKIPLLSNEPPKRNTCSEETYYIRWKGRIPRFILFKLSAIVTLFVSGLVSFFYEDNIDLHGVTCGPEMMYVPDIDTTLTCHFESEIILYFASYFTSVLTIILLVLLFISIIPLCILRKSSLKKSIRDVYKNEDAEKIINSKPAEFKGYRRLYYAIIGPKLSKADQDKRKERERENRNEYQRLIQNNSL